MANATSGAGKKRVSFGTSQKVSSALSAIRNNNIDDKALLETAKKIADTVVNPVGVITETIANAIKTKMTAPNGRAGKTAANGVMKSVVKSTPKNIKRNTGLFYK